MGKIQIRQGVFETNSSSTHSLTMCSGEEYDRWVNGEVVLYGGKFISLQEAVEKEKASKWYYGELDNLETLDDEEKGIALRKYEIYTYENYNDEYLEWFEDSYTTKSGERVIVFGQYGYEG